MMVQGAPQVVSQMAEQADNNLDDEGTSMLPEAGGSRRNRRRGVSLNMKEESSSSSGDRDDDDDSDDSDGDGWRNMACLLCGKPNDDLSDQGDHESTSRNKEEPYLCASCGQRFELIQHANAGEPQVNLGVEGEDDDADVKPIVHLEEADEELMMPGAGPGGGRNLECAKCGIKFEDAMSLERHAMMHMAYKCEVCFKDFYRKDKLKLHLMIHRGDKPLKCEVCGKAFLRKDHLKNHVKIHNKPASRSPKPGGKRRDKEKDKDKDVFAEGFVERDPREERPYGCDVCHKMFSRKDNLAAHMRIHTGEKPFGCEICGKHFAEKCALKRHMVVHTQEKLYACGICGRAFARKGHLTEHIWLHDEVKPFLCNVCGKAFARDRGLKSHMMTHSGERPYKCDVCDRAFARKDNLKSHLSLHYGMRPNRSARPRATSGSEQDSNLADMAPSSTSSQDSGQAPGQVPVTMPVGLGHPPPLMGPMVGNVGMGTMPASGVGLVGLGVGVGLVPS